MTESVLLPEPTAKQLLAEALDTIEASYWIRAALFAASAPDKVGEAKHKLVDVTYNSDISTRHMVDGKTAITGVCSLGAMALAECLLGARPLTGWESIRDRSLEARKAEMLLVNAIAELFPGHWGYGTEPNEIIINFNDHSSRERDDVIAVFRHAMESPLHKASTWWCVLVVDDGPNVVCDPALAFASSADAQAFIDEVLATAPDGYSTPAETIRTEMSANDTTTNLEIKELEL